jgi:hypothetical protein
MNRAPSFIRGWNIHMALYPWRWHWFYKYFSVIIYKMFWSRISWYSYRGIIFAIFVDVCDFIAEYWIQIVLMNLQYFAWISIKVTQDGATMVQVISLNPAGWSAERMLNFIAIFMKSLCDKQCISCMSSCRFCIKAASNILCHRIWSTMLACLCK